MRNLRRGEEESLHYQEAVAGSLINAYSWEEFGCDADFSDLKKVGIAYTTTEDGGHEIQVYANLKDYQIETYLDERLIGTENYASLQEMNENCLPYLSFDDLVCIPDEAIKLQREKEIAGLSKRNGLRYALSDLKDALKDRRVKEKER